MPIHARGRQYPIEISCVAWMDLLGYGAMLRKVRFDPSSLEANLAVKRLEDFQASAAKVANRYQRGLIINDGAAYVRELSPRSSSVTYDFLNRCFGVHQEINAMEKKSGMVGARMIIAAGARLRIANSVKYAEDKRERIIDKCKRGEITSEQAIHEAFKCAPHTGSTLELQANFAFTKAYLADADGSKAGLKGANLYVDSNLFHSKLPNWITVGTTVQWKSEGLDTTFYHVLGIDNEAANKTNDKGMRNALEIAKALGIKYG